jgi:hypothetical protein
MGEAAFIQKFLVRELKSFSINGESRSFENIAILSDVLLKFIEFDAKEELLAGLSQKLLSAFSEFSGASITIENLPGALEDLATGFESFLKKIAVVKYRKEPHYILYGDANYKGLLHTALGNLMTGTIDLTKKKDPPPTIKRPIIDYKHPPFNIQQQAYHRTKEVRNDIHVTKDRTFSESVHIFKEIVASYLFAVEENLQIIQNTIDPAFKYLHKLSADYQKVQKKVIGLMSEERSQIRSELPRIHALEWKDNEDDIYEPKTLEEEMRNDELGKVPLASYSALELPDTNDKFWVIGEPGAGKTFSLKAITYKYAQKIIESGVYETPYPVFVVANQFSSYKSFKNLIQRNIGLTEEQFDTLVSNNKLLIIIDGFNEIAKGEKNIAIRELQELSTDLNNAALLISARKYGFRELFDYPVFELLPLSDSMISEYINKYVSNPEKAKEVQLLLKESNALIWDFARNPLMLQMLIQVIVEQKKSPKNRGMLFYYFTHWIYSRGKKLETFDFLLTESILANIAFKLRSAGKVSMMKNDIFEHIKDVLLPLNYSGDITLVYEQLIDSFLEIDTSYKVVFFHELMLEYFAAIKLKEVFFVRQLFEKQYCTNVLWAEPMIMLTGIVEDATNIISSISKYNPILAARCIASGAIVSEDLSRRMIEESTRTIEKKNKGKASAITCLLELGTPDALRVIVKLPPKGENGLEPGIRNCQRPEEAVLKLFRFGLTGRTRVRKCLSVFYNKQISQNVLDSEEVAQAQKILFANSRVVEYKDLELIENMGISRKASDKIRSAIVSIVFEGNILSSLWRKAIQIAGDKGYLTDSSLVVDRLLDEGNIDGRMGYTLFVAANYLPKDDTRKLLALRATRLCIKQGFYNLVIKFIEHFNLESEISETEIKELLEKMAEFGKMKAIGSLPVRYPTLSIEHYLQDALDSIVKSGNMSKVYENLDMILTYHLVYNKSIFNEDEFIGYLNKSPLSKEKLKKLIFTLELDEEMNEIGNLKIINREKNFGFIDDLTTGETFFFRPNKYPDLNNFKFVKYRIVNKTAHTSRKSEIELLNIN